MAYQGVLMTIPGLVAGADLSAQQFRVMKLTGNLTVGLAGAGEKAIGILQNDPALVGEAASVAHAGVSKAVLGGVVAAGNKLASTAAGALVVADTDDYVVAIALEAGASGDVSNVLLEIGDDPIA
jgi:hypothetical protein